MIILQTVPWSSNQWMLKGEEHRNKRVFCLVKEKTETGSGISVPGNNSNFRELLYKAIYGSYEKHLGVRRMH